MGLDIGLCSYGGNMSFDAMRKLPPEFRTSDENRSGSHPGRYVAIDVDGTLANVFPVIINRLNGEKGTSYTYEQYRHFGGADLGMGWEEFHRRYVDAWTNHSSEIKPLVSEERLLELTKHYGVFILTAMGDEVAGAFEAWLKKNFPVASGRVFIMRVEDQKHKLENGFTFLIDDCPALASAHIGHRVDLLVSQPYNRDVEIGPNTIRVRSTDEAVQSLLRR